MNPGRAQVHVAGRGYNPHIIGDPPCEVLPVHGERESNVSATTHEQASASPVPGLEGWPVPNHFSIVSIAPGGGTERARIEMNDGREFSGSAVRLDCLATMLEFQPDGAPGSQFIRFSSFKSLCLTRPVELGRLHLAIPPEHVEAVPSQATLDFTIHFKDGSRFSSPILGIVARKVGLFPYLADDSGSILRWFMPAEATAGCRIGDALGKILVERAIVSQDIVEEGLERQRRQRATKLGEYLCRQGIVTREQVEACLLAQAGQRHLKLGEVLVAQGFVTPEQRDQALADQATQRGMPLGEILVQMGVVGRKVLRQALADQFGLPWVSLRGFRFEREAIDAIPAETARRHLVMPLYRSGARMVLALGNPVDWEAVEEIEFSSNSRVDPVLSSREDLLGAVARNYGPG